MKLHTIAMICALPFLALSATTQTARADNPADPSRNAKKPPQRLAMVVTNDDYTDLTDLPAVEIDRQKVTALLEKRHYKIYTPAPGATIETHPDCAPGGVTKPIATRNLAGICLRNAWDRFIERVAAVEEDTTVVFYFSGHGVEINRNSYLIPTDLPRNASEAAVVRNSLNLGRMFEQFRATTDKLQSEYDIDVHGIFIIDACRNPHAADDGTTMSYMGKNTPGAQTGIGAVMPPPDMLVMYSASSGQVSHASRHEHPREDEPSIYTHFLDELLRVEGADDDLETLARELRWKIHEFVQSKSYLRKYPQTPVHLASLSRRIGLKGPNQSEVTVETPRVSGRVVKTDQNLIWECDRCPEMRRIDAPRSTTGKDHRPTQDYAIGITEITRFQFAAMATGTATEMAAISAKLKNCDAALAHASAAAHDRENHNKPVINISFDDAQCYVDWLNEVVLKDVIQKRGGKGRYRLPTDAEWEYAARANASQETPYVYGEDIATLCAYGNGADLSMKSLFWTNRECSDDYARGPAPVGLFKSNDWGLKDVHGNVWEWVSTCANHTPAESGVTCRRFARGGSWRDRPSMLRLDSRITFGQGHRRATLGFRVARDVADAMPPEADTASKNPPSD